MKFKLDKNLDVRLVSLIAEGGHEADTVRDEGLSGSADQELYQICCREDQVMVTLDLDFANPVRFPPQPTKGIIVIRPPRPTLPQIRATLASALPLLKSRDLEGKLWIAEPAQLRVYEPEE